MADGGMLVFGLRHVYPIKKELDHVYNVLKGSDAVVYNNTRALGFEPVLHVYYEDEDEALQGVTVDRVLDSYCVDEGRTVLDDVQEQGGIPVCQGEGKGDSDFFDEDLDSDAVKVEWITPLTTYFRQEGTYATFGNEPMVRWAYGNICMVVRIGKAGDRLGGVRTAEGGKEKVTRKRTRSESDSDSSSSSS